MLSYRHAFHAGNHADVLKHFVLYLVLRYFNQKDKPYWYIDTHAGAGVYDLRDEAAQKVGEFKNGMERIITANALPELLAQFRAHAQAMLPENLYGGSPCWAQSLLRQNDKMRLFELHPTDFSLLTNNIRSASWKQRTLVKKEDGFAGLIALLPPATRRAVILIDPPYEQKQDYARVAHTLQEALKRFKSGCYLIWYPCLSRTESQTLPEKLQKLCPQNFVHAQVHVHAPRTDGLGMHASGMFVLNPPYLLAQQLRTTLPEMTRLLAQDGAARFILDSQIS